MKTLTFKLTKWKEIFHQQKKLKINVLWKRNRMRYKQNYLSNLSTLESIRIWYLIVCFLIFLTFFDFFLTFSFLLLFWPSPAIIDNSIKDVDVNESWQEHHDYRPFIPVKQIIRYSLQMRYDFQPQILDSKRIRWIL